VALAGWQRARAVERLPPDYDELVYLPIAHRYAALLSESRTGEVLASRENPEHPPLVKLIFAGQLLATGAPEPDWSQLQVGAPLPAEARRSFRVTRTVSAVAGVAQVAVLAAVHPVAALIVAVEPYHAKYTSQAYLEAVPGLFALLALLAFQRAGRRQGGGAQAGPGSLSRPWLMVAGVLLGVAAAGEYPSGLVVGLVMLAVLPGLTLRHGRRDIVAWALLAASTLGAFVLFDPALWHDSLHRWATGS
jgi:hypothetical protein